MKFDLPGMDTVTLSEKGIPMAVRGIDGKPYLDRNGKPVTITLLGPDSRAYRSLIRKQVRARMTKVAAGADLTYEEEEAEALEALVTVTVGWSGFVSPDGNPIQFSKEAAEALYRGFPAVRDQVDAFLGRRANFLSD